MIDFIKAKIQINPQDLLINPLLSFFRQINPDTGEIKSVNRKNKKRTPYQSAIYLDLEFRIYDTGSIYLIGSLHKFWNIGTHNYNDFNLNALYFVLHELKTKFNILPHQLILQQLEIGVNIQPPYKSGRIIDYCFIHRSKSFGFISTRDEGKYSQVQHSQYLVKFYDKRKHYSGKGFQINNEILRFEIKYRKMEKLNRLNIYTLYDLLHYGLKNFIPVLLNEWQHVLFYDFTINIESKPISNYKNPLYWKDLIDNKRNSALNKHRNKLKEIVANHSENVQEQITKLIEQKAKELMQGEEHFDRIYKVSDFVPHTNNNKRICPITNLDISMQKKDSFLLSHTGLKYYYQTDPKIYNTIRNSSFAH